MDAHSAPAIRVPAIQPPPVNLLPAEQFHGIETWGVMIRAAVLLTLIPAVMLGVITVSPSGAWTAVLTMAAYTAFIAFAPRRLAALRRRDLILVLDLIVITMLVSISGELRSPFLYLYYLVILEAAVRMNLRQALAASTAAAGLIILLWVNAGMGAMLESTGFYLGAFIAGGFLLALLLGMMAQEHRAGVLQAKWAALLDERLRQATGQLEEQLKALQVYNDLAVRLSGELRVVGVLEILLEAFLDALGVTRGAAYTVGEDGAPQLEAVRGFSRPEDDTRWSPDLPAAAGGGELFIRPLASGGPLPGAFWACVPVVRAGRPRAWFCALSDEPPVPTDAVRLRVVGMATQSVSALEAARLHEEVQRMIRTDPMRSLLPWAALEQLVADEIERCRTLMLVFSVAMIQIEDYATSRADAEDRELALRRIVKLLQPALRRVDLLSHDGAGRFALLLPRVPKVRAIEVLQELIDRLERDDVAIQLLQTDRLALTIGVVTFPEDGSTASGLFGGVEGLLVMGPTNPARVQVPAT